MMYLPEPNKYSAVQLIKTQWLHKMKAFFRFFLSLLSIQLLALILSISGSSSAGSTSGQIRVTLRNFSGDTIIGFTLFGVFIVSILVTTKSYRNIDFTFVTNRLCSNLSSIGFLLTYSIVGGITASLYSALIRVIFYFSLGPSNIIVSNFTVSPFLLLTGITAAVLCCILISSLGFFIGSLVRNTFLVKLTIAILIIVISVNFYESSTLFFSISAALDKYFTGEKSLLLFTVKILIASSVLYTGAVLFTNRLEVKR